MRFVISCIGFVFVVFGVLSLIACCADNLKVDYIHLSAAALGFGTIGIGLIIALLVEILTELKKTK